MYRPCMIQVDATGKARAPDARLQHGHSGGVLGSRSPATTRFFDCAIYCSHWHAQDIPDGTIHTLGTGYTLNFRIKRAATVSISAQQ